MEETFENALKENNEHHHWSLKLVKQLENNIKNIKNEFKNSKKRNVDLENTIQKLTGEIERMRTPDYEEKNIIEKLRNEIIYYSNLEKVSKELLVLVEYLSFKYGLVGSDYSPIILEYCKIVEIELFEKFTRKYESWILQNGIYLQTGKDKVKDINKFDKLTLGNYPILFNRKETKEFLRQHYNNVLKKMDKKFSNKLESITSIRNKCAHRATLGLEDLEKVKRIVLTDYNLLSLIMMFNN